MSTPTEGTIPAGALRRRARVAVLVVVAAIAGATLLASPADARTTDRSKPVLFVHGYNPTSSSTDCGDAFDSMIAQLRQKGFTGPMIKVGFYSGDTRCNVNLRSYGGVSDTSSWKDISKAFSRFVHQQYTSQGIAVDVVGYSMGGLITRGAIWGAQRGESGFSPAIDVEDVVTLGTPHNGAGGYSKLCVWGQCTGLVPGSAELRWLNGDDRGGRVPQGRRGTEFTLVGSDGDWIVPTASALHMSVPPERKVRLKDVPHTGSDNYMHNRTVLLITADALAVNGAIPPQSRVDCLREKTSIC